jgi:hypothetical protein
MDRRRAYLKRLRAIDNTLETNENLNIPSSRLDQENDNLLLTAFLTTCLRSMNFTKDEFKICFQNLMKIWPGYKIIEAQR